MTSQKRSTFRQSLTTENKLNVRKHLFCVPDDIQENMISIKKEIKNLIM